MKVGGLFMPYDSAMYIFAYMRHVRLTEHVIVSVPSGIISRDVSFPLLSARTVDVSVALCRGFCLTDTSFWL